MTGKTAFEKITDISDKFLEEAAFVPETVVTKKRRERGMSGFSRFMNSGWGVAMVCCLVAIGTIVGMVAWGRMGGPIEPPPGTAGGTVVGTDDWYETNDGISTHLTNDRRFDLSYAFSDGATSLSAKSGDTFGLRANIVNLGEPFIYRGASSGFVPYAKLVQSDGDYTIQGMIAHTEDIVEWIIETGHTDGGNYYFTVPTDAPEGTYDLILSYDGESRRYAEVLRVTRPNITETRAIELAKEALAAEYGLTDLSNYRIWSYKGSDDYSVTANLQIQGYATDEEYRMWMSQKGDIKRVYDYGVGTYACYLPVATAEAVKNAEERLAAQSGEDDGFYLVIDEEGYLCLQIEVIRGGGDDHTHHFYTERICAKPEA